MKCPLFFCAKADEQSKMIMHASFADHRIIPTIILKVTDRLLHNQEESMKRSGQIFVSALLLVTAGCPSQGSVASSAGSSGGSAAGKYMAGTWSHR